MTGPLCVAFASVNDAAVLPPALGYPEIGAEAVPQQQRPLLLVPTSALQIPIYHMDGVDPVLPFVAGQVLALVDSPHGLRHCCCDRGLLR